MTLSKGLLLKVAGGTVAAGGAGTTIFFAIPEKQQTDTNRPVNEEGTHSGVPGSPGVSENTGSDTATRESTSDGSTQDSDNEPERASEDQVKDNSQGSGGEDGRQNTDTSQTVDEQPQSGGVQSDSLTPKVTDTDETQQPVVNSNEQAGESPGEKGTEDNPGTGLNASEKPTADHSDSPESSGRDSENPTNPSDSSVPQVPRNATPSQPNQPPQADSHDQRPQSNDSSQSSEVSTGSQNNNLSNQVPNVVAPQSQLPNSSNIFTKEKVKEINDKLEKAVITGCNFEENQVENWKECSISKDDLEKIKFLDKEDENSEIEVEVTGMKLKVEYVSETKKIDYGLEDNLLFTFSNFEEGSIEIYDGLNLYKGTNPEFKLENEELEQLWGEDGKTKFVEKVNLLPQKGGTFKLDTSKAIKFSDEGIEDIKKLNIPSESQKDVTVTVSSGEDEGYNQGYKVIFKEKIDGNEGISLSAGNYEIKYKDGDNGGWYFSKKTDQ